MSSSRRHDRLRVGYVLKKYPRASETFIVDEILAVEAAGVDVSIVSLRLPDDGRFHADLARVRALVRYLPASSRASSSSWLDAVASLVHVQPGALGQAVGFVRLLPGRQQARVLLQGIELAEHAARERLDHLHAHFMTVAAHTTFVAHVLTGIPFTVTAHAKDVYRATVDPRVWQAIARRATAIVTVSDANERYIREHLLPSRDARVVKIFNGVPLDRLPAATGRRRDRRLVLAVGRLVEKKGFDVLLDACALLVDRGVAFRCVVVGDGDEHERLEARRRELGLDGDVTFTGVLSRDRVHDLMREARVLAAPFVVGADGNRDALPTVLLEALAAALPAVTTPVGGVPEIVRHEREGLIVAPRDPLALADGIARLLADDDLHARCTNSGRSRVREQFDRARTVGALLDLFAEGQRDGPGEVEAAGRRPAPATGVAHR